MDSNEHQAEEDRIRRILEIDASTLAIFDHWLLQEGFILGSTDEQAAREAVFKLHILLDRRDRSLDSPLEFVANLFNASARSLNTRNHAVIRDDKSAKYEAVRDLIHMIAVRKAQASMEQELQADNDTEAAGDAEQA